MSAAGRPDPRARLWLALAFLFLIGAAFLPARAIVGLARHASWVGGAQRLHWSGDARSCNGGVDSRFPEQGVRHDGVLWKRCNGLMQGQSTGLARIDPEKGEAQFIPFPLDLRPLWTSGLAPGPDGALAIVTTLPDMKLAVGIAGRDGWKLTPRRLPLVLRSMSLLSAVWVDSDLELVVLHTKDDDHPDVPPFVTVDRVRGDDVEEVGRLALSHACVVAGASCDLPCAAIRHEQRWSVLVSEYSRETHRSTMFELPIGVGMRVDVGEGRCSAAHRLDRAALGIPDYLTSHYPIEPPVPEPYYAGARGAAVLEQDGGVTKLDDARPWPEALPDATSLLDVDEGTLRRRLLWRHDGDATFGLTMPIDHGWIALREGRDSAELHADRIDAGGHVVGAATVAHTKCADLLHAVPVPRRDGAGFSLVGNHGECFLSLSPDLKRLDTESMLDHVRRGGADDPPDESNVYRLAWLLLGLPITVALFAAFARMRHSPLKWGVAVATAACVGTAWHVGMFAAGGALVFALVFALFAARGGRSFSSAAIPAAAVFVVTTWQTAHAMMTVLL